MKLFTRVFAILAGSCAYTGFITAAAAELHDGPDPVLANATIFLLGATIGLFVAYVVICLLHSRLAHRFTATNGKDVEKRVKRFRIIGVATYLMGLLACLAAVVLYWAAWWFIGALFTFFAAAAITLGYASHLERSSKTTEQPKET